MLKVILIVGLLAAAMLACLGSVNITGSGNVVTREEDISGFDKVDISHAFEVKITQDDEFSVVIRVDDNLVDELRVEKQGDTLIIGLKPGTGFNIQNQTMEADVTMPALTGIDASGASKVTVSGFKSGDSFAADISGASTLTGDIEAGDTAFDVSGASTSKLSGSAEDTKIDASGASTVDLGDFPVGNATIDASGASNVSVNVSGELNADANGASTITYGGNPTMGSIETSGSSNIKQK